MEILNKIHRIFKDVDEVLDIRITITKDGFRCNVVIGNLRSGNIPKRKKIEEALFDAFSVTYTKARKKLDIESQLNIEAQMKFKSTTDGETESNSIKRFESWMDFKNHPKTTNDQITWIENRILKDSEIAKKLSPGIESTLSIIK